MSKGVLHEILAVEADHEGTVKKLLPEAISTFKDKTHHFQGSHRTLKLLGGDGDDVARQQAEKAEEQHQEMVTTVHEKLAYVENIVAGYYDVVLQKEATNATAKADLVVDGVTIAKDIPVTFLLGLENKLVALRNLYDAIPTLQPGVKWEKDEAKGKHVYKAAQPEVRAKTTKTFKHQVLVQPTDKHPAQIEKWEETIPVGYYTKEVWSSCLTPLEKATIIGRIDDLIRAAKKARQRANTVAVIDVHIGKKLFDFIHAEG